MEFHGLVAASCSDEMTEILERCNIADAKRLYKLKDDSYLMVDGVKARMVAMATARWRG